MSFHDGLRKLYATETGMGNACSRGTDLMLLLSVLWNVSLDQPQRPLREFFRWPDFSIRDTYVTGILVNLFWFSRNYFNLALIISLVMTFYIPPYALILALSSGMHFLKRREVCNTSFSSVAATGKAQRKEHGHTLLFSLLVVLQASCCIFMLRLCGFYYVMVCISSVAAPIIAHALFTPYTDDAFHLYCSVLRQQKLPVPTRSSPTHIFSVDNAFEMLCEEDVILLNPSRRASASPHLPTSPNPYVARDAQKEHEVSGIPSRARNGSIYSGLRRVRSSSGQPIDMLCSSR